MLSVLEIEENLFLRNTYTRYHVCLMRVFILLLSIRYNMTNVRLSILYTSKYHADRHEQRYVVVTVLTLTHRYIVNAVRGL